MELAYIDIIALTLLAICFNVFENNLVLNTISIKYKMFRTIFRTISRYLYLFNSTIHSKIIEKPLVTQANGDKDY